MRIKNVTTGNIIINDLPNKQGFKGVPIPAGVEILIFNEDAERSSELGSFLTSGAIVNLGPEEPNSGSPEAETQPAVVGGYQVLVTNQPVAGNALVATDSTHAQWEATGGTVSFVDNEVPVGVIDGANTDFTLAQAPAAGSLHLYLNGLKQRPTVDYTIVGTTISFVVAPPLNSYILADYRL